MKFAIINDMHVGPSNTGFSRGVHRKLTSESEHLLIEFVEEMNTKEHPEFVINLGDSIEDVNDATFDIESFKHTQSLLAPLQMPTHWLIGNHDIRTLSKKQIADLLGYENMFYSFDQGEYHFIVLSFEMTGDHTHVFSDITAEIPPAQVEWLKADLAKAKKPTIIFIHYGLAEDDMKGNFWFEGEAWNALLGNRTEVKEILEKSGKVKAVFNAHQHWNKMHVEHGIPYFTVTSLVENFKNDGVPSKAHTVVHLTKEKIDVDVQGNDPAHYEFSF